MTEVLESLPKIREAGSPSYGGRLKNSERRLRLDQLKHNRRRRHAEEDFKADFRGDWSDRECRQKWDALRRERREKAQAEGVPLRHAREQQGTLPPLTPRAASPSSLRLLPVITDAKASSTLDEDDPDQPLINREKQKVPSPPPGPAPTARRPRPAATGDSNPELVKGEEQSRPSDSAQKSRPPPLLYLSDAETSVEQALDSSQTHGSCEDVVSPIATPGEAMAAGLVKGLLEDGPGHGEAKAEPEPERVTPGNELPDVLQADHEVMAELQENKASPSPVPQLTEVLSREILPMPVPDEPNEHQASAEGSQLKEGVAPEEASAPKEAFEAPPQETAQEHQASAEGSQMKEGVAPEEASAPKEASEAPPQETVSKAPEAQAPPSFQTPTEPILEAQPAPSLEPPVEGTAVDPYIRETAQKILALAFERSLQNLMEMSDISRLATTAERDGSPLSEAREESFTQATEALRAAMDSPAEQTLVPHAKPEPAFEAAKEQDQADLDDFLEEDFVIDINRPLKIEDFLKVCKHDMRWHQWPTISDRLVNKRPWSELPPADEAPEAAELPFSSEWFREHWSHVRTPSQSLALEMSLALNRPASAVSQKHSFEELVSQEAFEAKLAQVQRQRDGLPELDPPLLKGLDGDLPPPPSFAPPIAPAATSSSAAQDSDSLKPTSEPVLAYLVEVSILSGHGLRDGDWVPFMGGSDPYCVAELAGKADKIRTKTIPNEKDPEWKETGCLTITETDSIQFTVYDEDPLKPDDLLGRVSLKASQVISGGFDGELQLQSGSDKSRAGSLSVKVTLLRPVEEAPAETALNVAAQALAKHAEAK